jgi:hypothetical protein
MTDALEVSGNTMVAANAAGTKSLDKRIFFPLIALIATFFRQAEKNLTRSCWEYAITMPPPYFLYITIR